MKKKHSVLKDLLFVSISSFVVVAAWVGFNIYHTWVTTTITPEMQIQITAIDPNFDSATINKLKVRKKVEPVTTLSGKTATPSDAVPSPTSVPVLLTPSPEPSGTLLEPSPTAAVAAPTQPQETDIPVTVNGE